MADDPRRFDDLVRTIGDLRRQVDTLQSTALNRVATHVHAPATTGVGGVLMAYCTSDTTRNNSTTLLDVTGMSVSLEANATYSLDGWVYYTGNATADIKFAWSGPSGVGGNWAVLGPRVNQNPTGGGERFNYVDFGVLSITTALNVAADPAFPASVMPKGYVTTGGTSGAFKLQFAQDTANVSNTVVKVGSWVRLVRVA